MGGKRTHVMTHLQDLFPPERANAAGEDASGGERNRLLLARHFAKEANVLVLDEPTNDLDIDTLELLEDKLANYEGTVFIVSHDRRWDNVVTSCLVAEGKRPMARAMKVALQTGRRKRRCGLLPPLRRSSQHAHAHRAASSAPVSRSVKRGAREGPQQAQLQGAARAGRTARPHRGRWKPSKAELNALLADGAIFKATRSAPPTPPNASANSTNSSSPQWSSGRRWRRDEARASVGLFRSLDAAKWNRG